MVKATGIVRKVDDVGRIVVPVELRRVMGIQDGDAVQFLVDGETVVLRRYDAGCVFCGRQEDVQEFGGRKVCAACIAAMPHRPDER